MGCGASCCGFGERSALRWMWIVGGCGASVMIMMLPSHMPFSMSMLTYRRYGPKYTPFVGVTLYTSTPALGGGPVKPSADGVADAATDMMLSAYPGVCGYRPGESWDTLPLRKGDPRGLP